MAEQVYFDDVSEGMEIPQFKRDPVGLPQIIRFSAGVENYEQLHQDQKWCTENGFPDVLVNGPFKQAMLATMITNWIGDGGFLKKLGCQHRGMDGPGATLTATGKVTKAYEEGGLGYVELEVKVTNEKDVISCPGTATVLLPLRQGKPVPVEYPTPV